MGKKLHPSILPYWERTLSNHSNVRSWEKLNDPSDYIYLINRVRGDDVLILASDEYRYTLTDFFNRNERINAKSMIYLARPEANYSLDVIDAAKAEQITIGMLAEILGALNIDTHWNWESKARKEYRKR